MKTNLRTDFRTPENVKDLMSFLWTAGFRYFCLFGGAVRDIDRGVAPTDYDVRVWVQSPNETMDKLNAVRHHFDGPIEGRETNGKIRWLFKYRGMDIDLSPRVVTREFVSIEEVAKDRVADSDANCSQIAMDPFYGVHVSEHYPLSKDGLILLRDPKGDEDVARRLDAYEKKLRGKFPSHIFQTGRF